MSKLIKDVLYLIFKELHDERSLHSCLLVNKAWFETIVPILWKNPWKYLKGKSETLLLSVILSHLSNETKEILRNQGISSLLSEEQQKPLLNYISFCRHLNLCMLERMISAAKESIIRNEIYNLFINGNTKFTHLYIPHQLDNQIHFIPGAERCFSDLQFLSCNTSISDNVLAGLTEICKSIKGLELVINEFKSNYRIIELIETPQKLYNIRFVTCYRSFICRMNAIQDFMVGQPSTKMFSTFVNLKKLEIEDNFQDITWYWLKDLSLPFLQILRAKGVPAKGLTSLIESTSGHLIEIKIDYIHHEEIDNKRIIQAIYQKCPNLKYLKLLLRNSNISEFEHLLINCQYLNGLYIIVSEAFYWDVLFKILMKSSPTSLFKFKFWFCNTLIKPESLKLFFDNWEGKQPMLLQIIPNNMKEIYSDLIEEYKAKGIVKKHDHDLVGNHFEEFEWIQKKIVL